MRTYITAISAKIKKASRWLYLLLPLVILLALFAPETTILVLFGYRYGKCGSIEVLSAEEKFFEGAEKQNVYVYEAKNKPFLLIGPYTFSPGDRDFFFVNTKQVIRAATDKGGGAFCQLGPWLFVIDDMSGSVQNRVRTPYWDELRSQKASVVKKGDQYIYTLLLEDVKKCVTFAVPEKLFAPDMDALYSPSE